MTTVQRRGRSHGRGIPAVAVRPIDRSTPARRPRTAPDERPDMREPADQRMITDVSRLRPYRCTIIVRVPRTDYRVARPNEARIVLDKGHKSDVSGVIAAGGHGGSSAVPEQARASAAFAHPVPFFTVRELVVLETGRTGHSAGSHPSPPVPRAPA